MSILPALRKAVSVPKNFPGSRPWVCNQMFFTKFPHPSNFSFAKGFEPATGKFSAGDRSFKVEVSSFQGGIHRVQILSPGIPDNGCLTPITPPDPCDCHPIKFDSDLTLDIRNEEGALVLSGAPETSFGVSGNQWIFQFDVTADARFYGMGEKNFGRYELSGLRTKFWNTDVWGDFHGAQWLEHPTDPPYLSVPYLIIKQGDSYVGLLLHTAYPAFFETPGFDRGRAFVAWQATPSQVIVGAEGGRPDLWIIYGPTLKELTRKLQKLVGVTPLPPLWSLGYHQSRWGYAGHDDLTELDRQFAKHEIPCDSLWLDIDYMDGYRVFTLDHKLFPKGLGAAAEELGRNGRKLVAILDPGVKQEKGYKIYDEGKSKDFFCLNREKREYVGMVWPGETVFPDLTLPAVRDWWAGHLRDFAKGGLAGVWLDMNDPSTGPVDPTDLLFAHGEEPHERHRNQYALGMQMASYDGYLQIDPNRRPFLLSRSGSTGTSKYSAIWTGDNLSNYFYLKTTIPTTLNLSLSGIPFNGPDIGGFGGKASKQLMADWIKTCFLFPFARNHSSKDAGLQEPWAFDGKTLAIVRKFIRLRYKFLPYLYNLFCDQEELGDPILRPLGYEYLSSKRQPLDLISDQFLVGDAILQAPVMDEKKRSREIVLPGKEAWLDACSGKWIPAGKVRANPGSDETPLYFRSGAIVPMRPGVAKDPKKNLREVELFIAANPETSGTASYRYRADDGETFDYKKGVRSEVEIRAQWGGGKLRINSTSVQEGYGPVGADFLVPKGFAEVVLNDAVVKQDEERLELTGSAFKCMRINGA